MICGLISLYKAGSINAQVVLSRYVAGPRVVIGRTV